MIEKTYENLHLTCLTPSQHEKTCGYWYTITTNATPFTAFRTRDALEHYLNQFNLKPKTDIPTQQGIHASISLSGKVREVIHASSDTLPKGLPTLKLSNAEYTLGVMEYDPEHPILHYVGPNGNRLVFNYDSAQKHIDAGSDGPVTLT